MDIEHKRGDTFLFEATYYQDSDEPAERGDLTGYTVASQIRDASTDALIHTFGGFTLADQTDATTKGDFSFTPANDTQDWPALLIWDVQYSFNGIVQSTETYTIRMIKDVTRP